MYKLDLKKLINEVKGPRGVSALNDELHKVSLEIQKLSNSWKPQAENRLRNAYGRFLKLKTKLTKAQSGLEKELKATVIQVRKSATKAEKQIKSALVKATKKASAKATTKKRSGTAAKKVRRTTKKA